MAEKKPGMLNIEKRYLFSNVPFDMNMRCIIDIRLESGQKDTSVGWTSFDLFTHKTTIDTGSHLLKLVPPPIDFNLTSAYLTKTKSYNESNYMIAFHICDVRQKVSLKTCNDDFTFKFSKIKQVQERYVSKKYVKTYVKDIAKIEVTPESNPVEGYNEDNEVGLDGSREVDIEATIESKVQIHQFHIGFQIYNISNFPNIGNCFVRCIINDKKLGVKSLLFKSENTEPGEVDGTHGWQFCSYHQIKDLAGKKDRAGIFEIVLMY
jgi:hypothetical protein